MLLSKCTSFFILRSNVVLKYMLLVCLCTYQIWHSSFFLCEVCTWKAENKEGEWCFWGKYFMKDVFDLSCSKLQVYAGFVQSLEFLRKCWNLPSNFPDLEKVWKMEIKYGKIVKSLEVFFLVFKATISAN